MSKPVRKEIEKLIPYKVSATNYRWALNANESPYNLFESWQDEILAELKRESINRYPDANCDELRVLLSRNNQCLPENIICGNGSDEIIKMVTEVFVDKDDKVIIPTPTFSEYFTSATIAGGDIIRVPSKADLSFDINEIIRQANLNQAKLIFLCVPNNPTGRVTEESDILRVINETESVVAIDEAYYEFYGKTSLNLALSNPRVIIMRTLSKAFGVAGIRLGYAMSHPQTIDLMQRVRMPYNISALTQAVARVAVSKSDQIQQLTKLQIMERNRIISELKDLPLEIFESNTNFILYRSTKFTELVDAFEKNGIGIRFYSNDPQLNNCIRISLGTKEANDAVIATFKEVYNDV